MNKIKSCLFIMTFMLTFFSINVFADERACNYYASQGESACNSASYKGYKCEWNGNLKGGSRCKQSKKLANDVKETITSCNQIKDSETCHATKIDGHECIWRQNACYSNTMIDDGSGDTIVADDQDDRNKAEQASQQNASPQSNEQSEDTTYVGENICSEDSIQRVLKLVGYILIIIKVLVPLILVVMGSIDLFQAVVGKDEKALSKSIKNLMLRVVLGVFIFFIPTIVNWAFDVFYEVSGGENNKQCVNCVLDPGDC